MTCGEVDEGGGGGGGAARGTKSSCCDMVDFCVEAQSLARLAACRRPVEPIEEMGQKRPPHRGHNGGRDPGHTARPERAAAEDTQQGGSAIRPRSCAETIGGMRVGVDKRDSALQRAWGHGSRSLMSCNSE